MKDSSPSAPPSVSYIATEKTLGYEFKYPAEYLACVDWGNKDIDAGGDGHALSFLTEPSVAADLATFVRKATNRTLVPFARGGNGDLLYCFDGQGADEGIYVINLGEKPLRARKTGSAGFLAFINDYRANLDLQPWCPQAT